MGTQKIRFTGTTRYGSLSIKVSDKLVYAYGYEISGVNSLIFQPNSTNKVYFTGTNGMLMLSFKEGNINNGTCFVLGAQNMIVWMEGSPDKSLFRPNAQYYLSGGPSNLECDVWDGEGLSGNISFTFPATSALSELSLTTSNGNMNVNLSENEPTYGTWQMSWGNNPTAIFVPSESHILFKPKVNAKPNVSQSVDVMVGGQATTYNVNTNPQVSLEAGKDMQVQISSPAPTVTVDYTNTTTPVITDTPTGG